MCPYSEAKDSSYNSSTSILKLLWFMVFAQESSDFNKPTHTSKKAVNSVKKRQAFPRSPAVAGMS